VTLPAAVRAKLEAGRPLNEDEREMDSRVIGLSRDLVAAYPRMDRVAEGIGLQRVRYDGEGSPPGTPSGGDLPLGARILRLAVNFDAGMTLRRSVQDTISVLRADVGAYDPEVLDALIRWHAVEEAESLPSEVGVDACAQGCTWSIRPGSAATPTPSWASCSAWTWLT
jgi:response regulator RpfG family c-di-GMP phosphodiesterase